MCLKTKFRAHCNSLRPIGRIDGFSGWGSLVQIPSDLQISLPWLDQYCTDPKHATFSLCGCFLHTTIHQNKSLLLRYLTYQHTVSTSLCSLIYMTQPLKERK